MCDFRAHFDYDQPNKGEMSFRKGDIFHVTDTLHNNVVGSWQVYRIGKFIKYFANGNCIQCANACGEKFT